MELGAAVSGQHGIAHGGFLATIIDEVTGGLINASELDNGYGTLNIYSNPGCFIPPTIDGASTEGLS